MRHPPFWLLVPAIVILLVFQVYPDLFSIYLAFHHQRKGVYEFIGWRHFHIMWHNPAFWESIRHTCVFTLLYVVITLVLACVVALLLNHHLSPLSMVLLFIPWVLSDVVAGTIWRWMFIRDYGLLQELLFPFVSRTLLANPAGAMAIVVAASVWRSLAFVSLLMLAALQTVPREIQEHARLDGAAPHHIFWYITIPIIRPQIVIIVLMLTIRAINSPGLILTITGGGPARATNTLSFFLYQTTWQFGDFGLGAAMSVMLLVLNMVLTGMSLLILHDWERISRRGHKEHKEEMKLI